MPGRIADTQGEPAPKIFVLCVVKGAAPLRGRYRVFIATSKEGIRKRRVASRLSETRGVRKVSAACDRDGVAGRWRPYVASGIDTGAR